MDFARQLKTLRIARGLTQEQLAEKAFTSNVFISNLETNKMLPSPDLDSRLRKALDWTELEDQAFAILNKEPAGDAR